MGLAIGLTAMLTLLIPTAAKQGQHYYVELNIYVAHSMLIKYYYNFWLKKEKRTQVVNKNGS